MTFWRWVLKVFKRPRKPPAENLQVKTRVVNVRFSSWTIFFVGKYGIQSTNEMAFTRTVTLRASFRFPAIIFDAPTLLSFSGFMHAHTKCSSVAWNTVQRIRSPVLIRSNVWTQIETFISGVLMICENKHSQGNQLLYLPRVSRYLKLYEQVIHTVWPFNTGQDNRKAPVGTSQTVTATA